MAAGLKAQRKTTWRAGKGLLVRSKKAALVKRLHQTAKKRKILTKLRKQMDTIDNDFADGKINDEQYMIEQKKYLVSH